MDYTLSELVCEWKVRRGWEPLRTDAILARQDAMDIDSYIGRAIDDAYCRLLREGPLEALVVEDITSRVTVNREKDGVAVMNTGEGCRYLVEVLMDGWHRPATIVADDDGPVARRQLSPLSCGRDRHPVAVKESTGRVRLYSVRADCDLKPRRVLAVMQPPEGVYRLTDYGLNFCLRVCLKDGETDT